MNATRMFSRCIESYFSKIVTVGRRIPCLAFLGFAVILLARSVYAQGIVLGQGESFTYSFSSMPGYSQNSCACGFAYPDGGGDFSWQNSSSSTSSLEVIFYDSPTIYVRTVYTLRPNTSNLTGIFNREGLWYDHSGSATFTMITGTAKILSFSGWSTTYHGNYADNYSISVTFVPEPSPAMMSLLGVIVLALFSAPRASRRRCAQRK